jgi:hypothetical protein
MLAELGMSSIPSIFPVPKVQSPFREDGTPVDPATRGRSKKFFDELEWYACARRAQQAVRAQRVHRAAGRAHGGLSGRR